MDPWLPSDVVLVPSADTIVAGGGELEVHVGVSVQPGLSHSRWVSWHHIAVVSSIIHTKQMVQGVHQRHFVRRKCPEIGAQRMMHLQSALGASKHRLHPVQERATMRMNPSMGNWTMCVCFRMP